jgi:hypothetical protein
MNAILDFNEANDELDMDDRKSRLSEMTDYSKLTLESEGNDKKHCEDEPYKAIDNENI